MNKNELITISLLIQRARNAGEKSPAVLDAIDELDATLSSIAQRLASECAIRAMHLQDIAAGLNRLRGCSAGRRQAS